MVILGYVLQMISVPLLALTGNLWIAAFLIVLERFSRATRNPPRDVMISHAAKEIGYGWAFGIHEALDQAGALVGPIFASIILAIKGQYKYAFALLAIPAITTIILVLFTRLTYPHPERFDTTPPSLETKGLPRPYWIYLTAAILIALGSADFPFMAYHIEKINVMNPALIPVLYSLAMATSGLGSLLFGKLFDRFGIIILVPLTLSALYAPFVFMSNSVLVIIIGIAIWGLYTGTNESIIPAAVATLVPKERRGSAYGLFTAGYGIF